MWLVYSWETVADNEKDRDRQLGETKYATDTDARIHLLYQVKTQYLQILNIIDTSIKHAISG